MKAILVAAVAIPVLGATVLVAIGTSRRYSSLTPALTATGVATAIVAALYGFTTSTMPIAPYEKATPTFWLQLTASVGAFAVFGFGAGILAGAGVFALARVVIRAVRGRSPLLLSKKPPPNPNAPVDRAA